MNLMKLFNINYLKQNFKKSKVVLAIFIGLIPILNTIILTMILTSNKNYILNFSQISIINLIGLYMLPIIISNCLFNYIYKRKSVDFINSMPISRKSIFVTNTLSGIIVFILMLFINVILILIVTSIFNSPIPIKMLLDYFWFFLVVYIFTYSATNLAMSISGNTITQIVLTLLLFFLVPFTTSFTSYLKNDSYDYETLIECNDSKCMPSNYYCYDNEICSNNKSLNRYSTPLIEVNSEKNYTTPFGLLYNLVSSKGTLINKVSVIKMIVLSIIYIILGYILFMKRKMEINETSFKSIHVHNLVKSLTLVPIVAFAYLALRGEEVIFTVFMLVMLMIYYFVYDLITKKSIQNVKLSLVYFVVTVVSLTSLFSIVYNNGHDEDIVIDYNNIDKVAVNLYNYSYMYSIDNNKTKNIYTSNKELISLLTKSLLSMDEDGNNYFQIILKTKDNKEYKASLRVDDNTYNRIIEIISNEEGYINYYKNVDISKVYAVKIGNKLYKSEDVEKELNLINSILNNLSLKEYLRLQEKYQSMGYEPIKNIYLYTYEDYDSREFLINSYISYDLLNLVVNYNNSILKENITKDIPFDYKIYYLNSYFDNNYDIDYYVLGSAKNEIYDFIFNNLNEKVEMEDEYITFEINMYNGVYQYTTNKVEEIGDILIKKYQEIKDSPDYLEYLNQGIDKDGVEYYD